jgi:hypothetical protein
MSAPIREDGPMQDSESPASTADYPIRPVPFTLVHIDHGFWHPRLETNRTRTIPSDFKKCEETGRIDNFAVAAGRRPGHHVGIYYNDSDVYKVIEGASYSLAMHPDPELDRYLDQLIDVIAAAQEDDGYLYTARTIDPTATDPNRIGPDRWSRLEHSHELYNVGHLYEAAVAHFEATGKGTLLDVAVKNADLIWKTFGPAARRDPPGHQEIELGLVRLSHVTGHARYLELAQFFLDQRGQADTHELYGEYAQDHQPVIHQAAAVGHAVRATYMYCAMADVAALTGNTTYIDAIDRIWNDVAATKLYITGGIGARHEGEAFGNPYELPNDTAYAETCAAIANVMWNHRMYLLHGDTKYLDVLERTLYNGLLAGVSLSGTEFFYPNPLAASGLFNFNYGTGSARSPWFDCSCCPTNVARFLPSLPGYVYAQKGADLYTNLYVEGSAAFQLTGVETRVSQHTHYPWDGNVRLDVSPAEPTRFRLHLRVPGWALGRPVPTDLYRYVDAQPATISVEVNGQVWPIEPEHGYLTLDREWSKGDTVVVDMGMPVRRVLADDRVQADRGRVAVERGPLVYCAEGVDNAGAALDAALGDDDDLRPEGMDGELAGTIALRGPGVVLIPYYAWGHRGVGEMAVWLRRS